MDFLHFTVHILLVAICAAQESRFAAEYENQIFGPYRHIYPPADISRDVANCTPSASDPCPLFLAIMMSFGGSFTSSGVVPGMQLAIDQMNRDPYFLPGYRLHYALLDSRCNRQVTFKNFHAHLLQPPVKIGVLGSGCSTATEVTAEVGPFYNLTQISCLSSSHGLANRLRFTHYFQVSASDIIFAPGFFGIITKFGWQRVGILTQEEDLFTVTMDRFQYLLRTFTSIDVRESRFDTDDGIDALGENPFESEARVYVLSMFPDNAMALLCRAYQHRMFYPRALFLVVGWYDPEWWVGDAEQQKSLLSRYGCTVEQRTRVVAYTISIRKTGRLFTDASVVADSGINGSQIVDLYANYVKASSLNVTQSMFYQQCYDATWAMGRVLNQTYTDLMNNETLASLLAYHNSEVTGDEFNLHHFTYNNSAFQELMFDNLHSVSFRGIVGPIQFDEGGMRIVSRLDVFQYIPNFDEDGTIVAIGFSKFADIERGSTSEGDVQLIFLPNKDTQSIFPSGIPTDGIAREVDVGIRVELTIIFIVLAAIGSILAVVGMFFQFIHRKKVVVRLSSPNLNILIGFGAIILYGSIVTTVLPIVGENFRVIECSLTHWFTAIGYSLCYGTVLAKMARVYYIFDNPTQRKKKQALQDWMLALAVAVLVAIDVVILTTYNVVEGLRGNLVAIKITNPENPEDLSGASEAVTKYFIYVCDSRSRYITLGVLYGYKMIPQVIALIFAFSIRKIKIKGLDDAKYIAFSVYITSLVTVIVIVIIYTLDRYINIYAAIFCTGFFIGTTTILGLVMGPPLYNHYMDPTSSKVFPTSLEDSGLDSRNVSQTASRVVRASMIEIGSQSSGGDKKKKDKKVAELQEELTKAKVAHESTKAAHQELMASHSELIASHSELEAAHETTKAAHEELMASHSELIASHSELEASHSELKVSHSVLVEARARSPDILTPSNEEILQGRLRRNSEDSKEDVFTLRSRSERSRSERSRSEMEGSANEQEDEDEL